MKYNPVGRANPRSRFVVNLIFMEFLLLTIQFIIGIWMNLFAPFPSFGTSFFMYGMMQVMFSVPELMVHMMNGILIGLVSLMIFMLLATGNDYRLSLLGGAASFSILIAGISGIEFMFSGFTNNAFSFLMSLGFIFTVIAYSSILYIVSNSRT